MNDWKKLGWMAVASVAVFALAGCNQADARVQPLKARPAAVVASDAHPTGDAEADNGPGCAESSLHGSSSLARK
jgi:hypothetical protein